MQEAAAVVGSSSCCLRMTGGAWLSKARTATQVSGSCQLLIFKHGHATLRISFLGMLAMLQTSAVATAAALTAAAALQKHVFKGLLAMFAAADSDTAPSCLQDIRLTGVDPNMEMLPYLTASCEQAGFPASQLTFSQGLAEALPLPDQSQDVVISTLVGYFTCCVSQQEGVPGTFWCEEEC
jgi:hypothetical protein